MSRSDQQSRDPLVWTTSDDFILLCEFCEHEGPKMLDIFPQGWVIVTLRLTISDAVTKYNIPFDLNDFALRVMSVDYQRKGGDPSGSMIDTQVVIKEKTTGSYSYVHHFVLRDLEARGHVRPLVLCYVSKDYFKIMNYFADLMKEICKV